MVKIKQAIVVEGKYDKNTLRQLVDTAVFTTDGFGIMSDKAMLSVLRRVAEERGLIVLTDSDGAGERGIKICRPTEKHGRQSCVPAKFGKSIRRIIFCRFFCMLFPLP